MREYRVYKITNTKNGNFYIGYTGMSLEKRFRGHKNTKDTSMPIVHAIKKYGKEYFVIEEISLFKTKQEACAFEIKMIAELNPHYNVHPGGSGGALCGTLHPMYGKKHSKEWKKQKSLMMSGNKNPMYGQTHTLEARQKICESRIGISAWNKGKVGIYDSETLKKLRKPKSQQHKEKLSREFSFINPSGKVVKIRGLLNFCKEEGLNPGTMSQVYHGIRKQHKGWTAYKDNNE